MSQTYAGGIITANQNSNFSGLFSGSNSFLSFPGAAQYAIANSTTPFTIEAWVKPYTAGGLIFSELFEGGAINIACSLATSNDVSSPSGLFPAFGWYTGSAWVTAAASTTPVVLNTWTHVAFVFTGSTSRIYINGVDVTKVSSPTPQIIWGITASSGTTWYIGRRWDTGGSNVYFDGLINNFRFVNGTAVYTSNFTVPTNLTAITNTVMLTCQGSTFVDASSYAATITNNNGVIVSTDNPFYTQSSPALGAATPGVWTLSQANQAAGQRSWPMYDPFFNLTTSMIHGNGTNGATNNTFLDSSSNNFSVTRNGNTTQGTFTPFSKPNGYWSNFFDGTGDYLTLTGSSNLALGTGDFTIECFFYLTVLPVSPAGSFIYDSRPTADGAYPCIFVAPTTNVLTYYVSTASRITGTTVVRVGQWNHVVVSRVSGTTRMFLNGAQQGSNYTDATNYLNGASRPVIANNGLNLSGHLTGYISNLRVLKGTGVTSVTVPTAPLTAVTNTQLLTCQSNQFIDNSANNFTVTRVGDVRTLTYSPFYDPTAYYPVTKGGAMYFDGSGDYLTVAGNSNLALGTGNFTIEFFIFLTTTTNSQFIYDATPLGASGAYPMIYMAAGPVIIFATIDVDRITSNSTIVRAQWNHVVVSRVSGTTRMFINGVQQTQTYTDSNNYLNGTDRPRVGFGGQIAIDPFNGFISNLRVLKGTGVTSVTVPTAPLTPITNTQLLLSGTNAAVFDNATNVTAETNVASISTAQNKYGSGSMSFNGSTTYIRLTNPFGSGANLIQTLGDFTVEAWINPTSIGSQQCVFCINANTSSYAACRLDINTTGGLQLLVSTNGSSHAINTSSAIATPTGAWTHVAVVRHGPSYIVYKNGSPVITSTTVTITTAVLAGTISSLGALFNTAWATFFNGYMIDFRATNYARYLGVFTPPTSTLQNQ
jgi:hypothetical protein